MLTNGLDGAINNALCFSALNLFIPSAGLALSSPSNLKPFTFGLHLSLTK